jgi:hypothetical protein
VKKNKAKTEILTTKKNVDFQEMILIKIGGHLMEEKVQIVNGRGGSHIYPKVGDEEGYIFGDF